MCFPTVGSEKTYAWEIPDRSYVCSNTCAIHKRTYLNITKKNIITNKQLQCRKNNLKPLSLATNCWHKKKDKTKAILMTQGCAVRGAMPRILIFLSHVLFCSIHTWSESYECAVLQVFTPGKWWDITQTFVAVVCFIQVQSISFFLSLFLLN